MERQTLTADDAQLLAQEMLEAMEAAEERVKHNREDRIATALERIADALETRNTIDSSMANFAELLTSDAQGQRTVTGTDGEHSGLAPDGLPWGKR